jgi:ATP-dependent helicase YprA (DUF1998 family)
MLEAITYQGMLRDIINNQIKEDTIGILITRPDLEGGKSIMDSLNYMIQNNVIASIPSFFQQLFRIYKNKKKLNEISNTFGKDKLFQVTKDTLMDKVPAYLTNIFTHEKYFCVKSYSK